MGPELHCRGAASCSWARRSAAAAPRATWPAAAGQENHGRVELSEELLVQRRRR